MGRFLTVTYTWARRCMIALIGTTVILIGVLMIVLPGPAFIVIPAGLAILGIEFACARRWLKQLRATGTQVWGATVLRWFRKQPRDVELRNSQPASNDRYRFGSQDRAHAAPPYALPHGAPRRGVTANTKTGYYRAP